MRNHLTKIFTVLMIFQFLVVFFLGIGLFPAEAISGNKNDRIKVTDQNSSDVELNNLIKTIPQLLTDKNYSKLIELADGGLKDSLSYLLLGPNSKEFKANRTGLWNINSVELLKYKQVANKLVPVGSVHYADFADYQDVVTYYVSAKITAIEDDFDVFSGTNYFIWVFGKNNNGEYKLLQWSQPIIEEMEDKELTYNDGTEYLQKDIQKARQDGVILDGNKIRIEKYASKAAATTYDPVSCPIKSSIRVQRVNLNFRIDAVNFYTYVKNVLPNEWYYATDPIE